MTDITAAAGVEFLSREAGSAITTAQTAAGTTPKWLRITRAGNVFTSYTSIMVQTWTHWYTKNNCYGKYHLCRMAVTYSRKTDLATGVFSDGIVRNITPP